MLVRFNDSRTRQVLLTEGKARWNMGSTIRFSSTEHSRWPEHQAPRCRPRAPRLPNWFALFPTLRKRQPRTGEASHGAFAPASLSGLPERNTRGFATELAADLREQIREQMKAGRNDKEIVAFLTDRYGDFVLYRPPLKPRTYVLWF